MKNEEKLTELINRLKSRDNKSYEFFQDLLLELRDERTEFAAKQKLSACFHITQYANFTFEEENLLSEIIDGL